jgi:excinuclease ABC subunit A
VDGLKLTKEQEQIAEPILREVGNRLRFLTSVGLDYLSLDRRTATLSGGEAQRIRLATQVGSGLVGACYVLDEPTIGLHERDNDRLIKTLRHLTDIGNTVLVVEHDEDMIRHADHVVDIGPGPGVHGGRIVAQGTVEEICATEGSITGRLPRGAAVDRGPEDAADAEREERGDDQGGAAQQPQEGRRGLPGGRVRLRDGRVGVGQVDACQRDPAEGGPAEPARRQGPPGEHARVNGLQRIDRIIEVDQSPIGRTPRSNPATYTGIFDDIRKVFTQTKEAKIRGYQPGRFSFNVPATRGGKAGSGGRCEACQGQGLKKIEMHFLPDVYVGARSATGSGTTARRSRWPTAGRTSRMCSI